jgi:hypothetical protein
MAPIVDGERRIYTNRARQRLVASSLIALYLVSLSLIFEPDPTTGLKPLPSDYVWIVVPGGILIAVLAWRTRKARLVTDRSGIDIIRVVGHEMIPWREMRRFEVHPTPGRQGYGVVARLGDERLVNVSTEIAVRPLRDRQAAKATARQRAGVIVAQLEADRAERTAASRQDTPDQPVRG